MGAATSPDFRILVSAGEASGDQYGAALIDELRKRLPPELVSFAGMGSRQMASRGVRLVGNSSTWGAISIIQSLRIVPRVFGAFYRMKSELRRGKPGLFVPIDFGYANIRLARHAKAAGWKVLYFVPPGSWRRDRQGRDLPAITDAISTPFAWSADLLNQMGAKAHWFGHPIKQLVPMASADSERTDTVAVLPGSRPHEVEFNLPVIAEALANLSVRLEFAVSPNLDATHLEAAWRKLRPERSGDRFLANDLYGILGRVQAAVVCSGTATLEAALSRCPMVVMYQLSPAMRREGKLIRFKRPKFIALPNILLDRFAVPEIAEADGVDPVQLRTELDLLLTDAAARERQLEAFTEIDQLLGPSDAISRTADLAVEMLSVTASAEARP